MNLLFIYGPPAAGKLTISKAIATRTGYKVYDNHQIANSLATLFPFDDRQLKPIRQQLQRRIRIEIFRTAAKAGVNFITTSAVAGGHFDFYREAKEAVEKTGGRIYFVQLAPSKETLFTRVESESRKGVKIETAERLTAILENEPELWEKFPDVEHLTLDNSDLFCR